jgi:magnesium chelatase family protein
MLDRIDLHIEVPDMAFHELSTQADGTSSAILREQVSKARAVQRQRFGAETHILNGRITTRQLRRHCVLDEQGKALLKAAMDELGLWARAHDRILRVARTISTAASKFSVTFSHVLRRLRGGRRRSCREQIPHNPPPEVPA